MGVYFIVLFFGLCIGSFLNVCIYRLPRSLSIVTPASFCPHCSKPIRWWDNIPVVSYLLLRGRCRDCHTRISLRYPAVEILSGGTILYLYTRYGWSTDFFKFSFLLLFLILISFIDIDFRAIPNYLCFIGVGVGIFFSSYETINFMKDNFLSFSLSQLPVVNSIKGLIFGFGFTYLFKFVGDTFLSIYLSWRRKESIEGEKESLGLGDVDFMGMIGVFLGVKCVVLTFFLAPFLALFYSLFALVFKKSHIIPYLPYLSLASFISFLWADKIFYVLMGIG